MPRCGCYRWVLSTVVDVVVVLGVKSVAATQFKPYEYIKHFFASFKCLQVVAYTRALIVVISVYSPKTSRPRVGTACRVRTLIAGGLAHLMGYVTGARSRNFPK